MQYALSRQVFDATFPSRLNGGKIKLNWLPQSAKKASFYFRLRSTRPENIILKLCIYSGYIRLLVAKLSTNFNKCLRIKLPFGIVVKFFRKLVCFSIVFPGMCISEIK